jgi:hypothetical protein
MRKPKATGTGPYPLPPNPQCDMVTSRGAGDGYCCCAMTQGHCGPHVPIYALDVVWMRRPPKPQARVALAKSRGGGGRK